MNTLVEVKDYLKENWKQGCLCPACTQNVKLYRRSLTSSMAYALILIYKHGSDYFHVEKYLKALDCPSSIRGDFPKLRFFGLIESREEIREDGSGRNGYYRITQKGIDFVNYQHHAPEAVYIFNNKVYPPETPVKEISIIEALKNKFNYSELMMKGDSLRA